MQFYPKSVSEIISSINQANSIGGSNTINLQPQSEYILTDINNSDATNGPNGLPVISSNLTINGNGATIRRDSGASYFRICFVAKGAIVTINDLTIKGGYAGAYGPIAAGAGIYNSGDLTLKNCSVLDNYATGDTDAFGAGIISSISTTDHTQKLTVINCNISNNISTGSWGQGGGILCDGGTSLVQDSVISYNEAGGVGGGLAVGIVGSTSTIQNCVFLGNKTISTSPGYGGGAIAVRDGTHTITQCTFYRNNSPHGSSIKGIAGYINGNISISNSNILDNIDNHSVNSIDNDPADATINASNNWWGATDGPYVTGGSGSGAPISSNVTYNPFLTSNQPVFEGGLGLACELLYKGKGDKNSTNPIGLQYGEKREEATDFSLNTPAGALSFSRVYRQSKQLDSTYFQLLGLGWSHNHAFKFTFLNSVHPNQLIQILLPDGGMLQLKESTPSTHFVSNGSGSTAYMDYDSVTHTYTLTGQDKSKYVFDDANYTLKSRSWPNNEVWTYTYSGSNKLSAVSDGYGRQLNFAYINDPGQFDDGLLWRVGDQTSSGLATNTPTGRYVEFAYVTRKIGGVTTSQVAAQLASVRDVRGNTWTYRYYGQSTTETDANQTGFLMERLSPGIDMNGDQLPDGAISLEKLSYIMSGTSVQNMTQWRGAGSLQTDFAFQANAARSVTTEKTAGKTITHRFDSGTYMGTQDAAGNYGYQVPNQQFRPSVQNDARGNVTQMAWSADGGQLNSVVDAQGNKTAFSYVSGTGTLSDGALSSSLDAQGRTTQYLYGDVINPRLPTSVKVLDTDGVTVLRWQQFSYDNRGRTLVEQTLDPANGLTVQQEVDRTYYISGNGNGLLKSVTQRDLLNPANNVTTTYFYDSVGRVIRTKQSATFGSCLSSFSLYDAAGNVLASICNYDPGVGADPVSVAQAVALFNPAVPDANKVTLYEYDALNRRVKTTTDAGAAYAQTALTVYDALSRVVRTFTNYVADPAIPDPFVHARADFQHGPNNTQNLISETTYNERGFVKTQSDVLGNVTLFGYDDAGQLVKTVQSASQPTYDNSYGPTGDPTLSQYFASSAPDLDIITLNQYDPVGNLVKQTDTIGNVTLTGYDPLNRPVKVIQNASNPAYDLVSDPTLSAYPTSVAADQDLVSVTEYDAMSRVRRTQDTLGSWTLYGYDALGRQAKVIRSASQPTYDLTTDFALSAYPVSDAPDQDIVTQTTYDPFGRVLYTTDPLGRTTWSAYDGLNRVVRTVTNASGSATDGSANDPRSPLYRASSQSDQDLVSTTSYDVNGYVLWTQDPLGHKTWFGYDLLGRQTRTVANSLGSAQDGGPGDPRSSLYVPSLSADQDLISQTEYDAQGRVTATLDTVGKRTQYTYDTLGRRVQTIANFVTGTYHAGLPDQDLISTTTYDLAGRVVATTDARGTQTTFTYDRVGRRLTVTQAAGTGVAVTSYTCYDKAGRVLRTIQNYLPDPRQPTPDATDDLGRYLFNPAGNGLANDQNLVISYTLDRSGRQLAVRDPLLNTTAFTYYKDGQLESTTDPLGTITKYRYDQLRRRLTVVQGFVDNGQDPALWAWTGSAWTKFDRVTAITFGPNYDQNSIVRAEYDKAGRVLALRDPLGHRTTYAYDQLNRRTSLTNPLNQTWQTLYKRLDQASQTQLVQPSGKVIQQTTDRAGRLAWLQYADSNTPDVAFAYDKLGNRLSMAETNNALPVRTTTFQYDQVNRLRQVNFDTDGNGTIDQSVAYQYDAGGLRTGLTLPGSLTMAYTYDARGQLTTLTDWNSQQTAYAYDGVGRLNAMQQPNQVLSQYRYDAAGRLRQLRHSTPTHTLAQFAYTVDARGNRTDVYEALQQANSSATDTFTNTDARISYYVGSWSTSGAYTVSTDASAALKVAFSGTQAVLTMGTDADHSQFDIYVDGDLWNTANGYSASPSTQSWTINLLTEGPHLLEVRNRPERDRRNTSQPAIFKLRFNTLAVTGIPYDLQTTHYTYDQLARLLSANTYPGLNTTAAATRQYSYTYDSAGNRTSATLAPAPAVNYTYNAANQLIGDGTFTYTYNPEGTRSAKKVGGSSVETYFWDAAQRLILQTTPLGNTSFTYNALGQRIQQTSGPSVTNYLVDLQPGLWKLLTATDSNGTTRYVHGPTGIQQQQNTDATWRWTLLDGLGSVRSLVDNLAVPQETHNYSPYGESIGGSGTSQSLFGFTGEPTQSDTGWVYLRARYYHPNQGQFVSLDPLEGDMGRPMSLNRFAYVQDNPVNLVDPSGLIAQDDLNLLYKGNSCASNTLFSQNGIRWWHYSYEPYCDGLAWTDWVTNSPEIVIRWNGMFTDWRPNLNCSSAPGVDRYCQGFSLFYGVTTDVSLQIPWNYPNGEILEPNAGCVPKEFMYPLILSFIVLLEIANRSYPPQDNPGLASANSNLTVREFLSSQLKNPSASNQGISIVGSGSSGYGSVCPGCHEGAPTWVGPLSSRPTVARSGWEEVPLVILLGVLAATGGTELALLLTAASKAAQFLQGVGH